MTVREPSNDRINDPRNQRELRALLTYTSEYVKPRQKQPHIPQLQPLVQVTYHKVRSMHGAKFEGETESLPSRFLWRCTSIAKRSITSFTHRYFTSLRIDGAGS